MSKAELCKSKPELVNNLHRFTRSFCHPYNIIYALQRFGKLLKKLVLSNYTSSSSPCIFSVLNLPAFNLMCLVLMHLKKTWQNIWLQTSISYAWLVLQPLCFLRFSGVSSEAGSEHGVTYKKTTLQVSRRSLETYIFGRLSYLMSPTVSFMASFLNI